MNKDKSNDPGTIAQKAERATLWSGSKIVNAGNLDKPPR